MSRTRTTGKLNRTPARAGYVYGSAAPKIDYYGESRKKTRPAASSRAKTAARRNREKAAHMNPGYVVFMIGILAAMVVILISYISLQARITSSVKDISSLESQLATLRAANDEKLISINSSSNLEEIKDTALTELGMKYADKDQIITYSNSSTDYVRQVAQIP